LVKCIYVAVLLASFQRRERFSSAPTMRAARRGAALLLANICVCCYGLSVICEMSRSTAMLRSGVEPMFAGPFRCHVATRISSEQAATPPCFACFTPPSSPARYLFDIRALTEVRGHRPCRRLPRLPLWCVCAVRIPRYHTCRRRQEAKTACVARATIAAAPPTTPSMLIILREL